MSHADMNNCSGFNEAAAAFSWNSPKKAINPYPLLFALWQAMKGWTAC